MTRLLNQKIGGRPATIAFLTAELDPTTPERAALLKVLFQDARNETMIMPAARSPSRPRRGNQTMITVDSYDPIDRILMLLEGRLAPEELDAVRQILLAPPQRPVGQLRDPEQISEDGWPRRRPRVAERAQAAFDARFPEAKRVGIEPDHVTSARKTSATTLSGFNERYPEAKRIGAA